ncbi:MAG TPA: HD domain-containing protein [Candidatus Acidoferrales bacterium]|nr:HD domain-containing protein [Candidatus Acidoferrales bacterium]
MKALFIADLKDGQAVASFFLISSKEIRTSSRTGKSWLQLELSDRTGRVSGKMWDNFADAAARCDRDAIVKVQGRAKIYNDQIELTIELILPAQEGDYDIRDFLPHTKEDVEKLYARLREAIAAVKDPCLKNLLSSVVDDAAIAPKLKRAPAATTMHHAFIGGLLEHIVSVIGLMERVTDHYPELDRDLLLTGVVLHDIGKTEELSYARGFGYTTEGQLLGHIALGLALVRRKIESIPDFPRPLAVLVEHLILSHHGTHEFGSPQLPQFREAVVLHYLDDLDSKMAAMRATLEGTGGEDEWSDRNPSLRRQLLRTADFLCVEPAQKPEAAKATTPVADAQKSLAWKK